MKTPTPILETKSLSVGYSNSDKTVTEVLSKVDLTLNEGRLIAMVGPNGAGKSTLLRTLCGLQKPLAGEILLDGQHLELYTPRQLAKKTSVVLTEKLPPGNLTVYEVIALGRQPYTNWLGTLTGEDRRKVTEAAQQAGIAHLAEKKYFEISDGQLQNVLIARALAQDTPLIILDEPATHLDLPHKLRLMTLLKDLALKSAKCIVFSTHDIESALEFCDEVIIVNENRVMQETPASLLEKGVIDQIFNDPTIIFDKNLQRLTVRQDHQNYK